MKIYNDFLINKKIIGFVFACLWNINLNLKLVLTLRQEVTLIYLRYFEFRGNTIYTKAMFCTHLQEQQSPLFGGVGLDAIIKKIPHSGDSESLGVSG